MKPKPKITVLEETLRLQRELFLAAAELPHCPLKKLLVETIAVLQIFIDCQSPK